MNILFLGGDKRYLKIILELSKKHNVSVCGYDSVDIDINKKDIDNINFKDYKVIILPMSGINNENIVKSLDGDIIVDNLSEIDKDTIIFTGIITQKLKELNCDNIVSFLSFADIKELNTKITVDGIEADIKDKNKTSVCILGYGNIGKELYDRLNFKNIRCIVGEIDESKTENLPRRFNTTNIEEFKEAVSQSSIIVNTVPHNIISDEILQSLNNETYILDIASYPHGINKDNAAKNNLNYNLYLGIPGKYNPSESAVVLLKKVEEIIGG